MVGRIFSAEPMRISAEENADVEWIALTALDDIIIMSTRY